MRETGQRVIEVMALDEELDVNPIVEALSEAAEDGRLEETARNLTAQHKVAIGLGETFAFMGEIYPTVLMAVIGRCLGGLVFEPNVKSPFDLYRLASAAWGSLGRPPST